MADENALKQARTTFRTLCEMMQERDWHFEKDEEHFRITCGAQGEDLPIKLRINVDPDRLLIMIFSEIPFPIPENRRSALAIAVSAANFGLIDGSFDYSYLEGGIVFRLTSSFRESLIGKDLFEYMLMCTCFTVDKYNDKFLMVVKKDMSPEEIVKFMA